MGYTWRQFETYRALADRRQAAHAHTQLVTLLAAAEGGKQARGLLQRLSAAAEGKAP